MRFKHYSRGSIVAYALDEGTVGLRHRNGLGLLRTSNGIPHSAIKRDDLPAVVVILGCIFEDVDHAMCLARGVEVGPVNEDDADRVPHVPAI